MPQQNPMPLFQELKTMHRALFQEQFERLEWEMVASFETSITRKGSTIAIKQTTFWLSSERDPNSGMTMAFRNPKAKHLGTQISNDAVTQATGVDGDIKFVLGFANDENVANGVFNAHMQDSATETGGLGRAKPSPTRGLRRYGG
eukprot:480631-Prymnesium_polylepis.1